MLIAAAVRQAQRTLLDSLLESINHVSPFSRAREKRTLSLSLRLGLFFSAAASFHIYIRVIVNTSLLLSPFLWWSVPHRLFSFPLFLFASAFSLSQPIVPPADRSGTVSMISLRKSRISVVSTACFYGGGI